MQYIFKFHGQVCQYVPLFNVTHAKNNKRSGKELFIRFTARAFRKLLSIYVFTSFHFGFEGRIWDLIVSVPDLVIQLVMLLSTEDLLL